MGPCTILTSINSGGPTPSLKIPAESCLKWLTPTIALPKIRFCCVQIILLPHVAVHPPVLHLSLLIIIVSIIVIIINVNFFVICEQSGAQ